MAKWWVRWCLAFSADGGHHNIFLPTMAFIEASVVFGTSLWLAKGQQDGWELFCPHNLIYISGIFLYLLVLYSF